MNEVTQADLARVFVTHFDRLQGVDYVFRVLLHHLHERGLIDPSSLATQLRAVADTADREQSEEQAIPARRAAEWCDTLRTPPKPGAPDWLRGVIDGGKHE